MLSLVAGDLRRGLRPQRDSNWCSSRGKASARPLQHPKRQCLPLRTQEDGQLSLQGGATKYLNNYVVWYGFLHAAGEAKRRDLEDLLFEDRTSHHPIPVFSKSQKQRDMLALLGLKLPPKTLR